METKKTYEGMFLLDAGNPDFNAASEPVRNILTRYEAEFLTFKPWDERRLAYEISGRKRGLYVLIYFKLDPLKVREVEHDCRLDERVLRALILRRDRLTPEEIAADTPATTVRTPAAAPEGAAPIEGVSPAEIPDVLDVPDVDEPQA
jgi:small subunit ribosomal protein S6